MAQEKIDWKNLPEDEAIAYIVENLGMDPDNAGMFYAIGTGQLQGDAVDEDGNAFIDEIGMLGGEDQE